MSVLDIEDIEVPILLDAIHRRYGIDFRDYARASLRRRIRAAVRDEHVPTVSALQAKLLHDPLSMERFLFAVSQQSTRLFRDPGFYAALRQKLIPVLKTYPFIRIWHAGCSTGEDVVATAIVLEEEGLADRCRIYATDVSEAALKAAKSFVYSVASVQEATKGYIASGGTRPFSDYYTSDGENVIFRLSLRKNIVYAPHNLACDGSFNEFNLIVCRNVTLSFNRGLQDRVHELLHQSLGVFGVLALGARESLRGTPFEDRYEELVPEAKLFRRVR
ncbi:MAG: protein-glutamate O-methyltransferase CheR [Planctomycetota bacterium]